MSREQIMYRGGYKKIAHIYYLGLKLGAKPSTDPKDGKPVHTAP